MFDDCDIKQKKEIWELMVSLHTYKSYKVLQYKCKQRCKDSQVFALMFIAGQEQLCVSANSKN